jgi:UDPglucose 6-dehydrogenase
MEDQTIGVIGLGYVGGAFLRGFSLFNDVRGYDTDEHKSTHTWEEVVDSDIIVIAVPTPMQRVDGGEADLGILDSVFLRMVKHGYNREAVIIIKSTIPPGTTSHFEREYKLQYLAHCPEFLSERTHLIDFNTPAAHIIGSNSPVALSKITQLFSYRFKGVQCYCMKPEEAETVKYVNNCFYATKVMYFNMVYQLAEALEMDFQTILAGALSQGWISHMHTRVPGPDGSLGVGGKCLPKDINAFKAMLEKAGVDAQILDAVWEYNKRVREEWDWADIEGAVSEETNG